jgi:uncharacterized protein YoxC
MSEEVIAVKSKGSKWKQSLIEYGTATILIALVVWFVVSRNLNNNDIKNEVAKTNSTIENLETQIDSVKMYQELLLQRTYDLEENQATANKEIEKNNALLNQNKVTLEKIRYEYNEKINNVSTFSYSELDSFFAKRYKNYK